MHDGEGESSLRAFGDGSPTERFCETSAFFSELLALPTTDRADSRFDAKRFTRHSEFPVQFLALHLEEAVTNPAGSVLHTWNWILILTNFTFCCMPILAPSEELHGCVFNILFFNDLIQLQPFRYICVSWITIEGGGEEGGKASRGRQVFADTLLPGNNQSFFGTFFDCWC